MPKKSCPICGSRKWRKDGVTGNAICEDGHVFQDFRSENLVMEATGQTLQRRNLRKNNRKEKQAPSSANLEFFHGNDAEYIKLQAFQLLLRYQVQALAKLWSLPDIFEPIVRDLWSYQLLIYELPERPKRADERAVTPDPNPDANQELETLEEEKTDEKHESDSDTEVEEVDDKAEDSDGPEVDSDILAELSEDSADSQQHVRGVAGKWDAKWKRKRRIRASDVIVTLVMGLWIIRYPLLHVDLENLINENGIPYLDFGHTTLVPAEMSKHFNREVMRSLCPGRAPSVSFIHRQLRAFGRVLTRHFGLVIPEMNLPPVAWKVLQELGGSAKTYAQVMNFLALVDANLSLNESEIRTFTRKLRRPRADSSEPDFMEYEATVHNEEVWLPEVSVAAAWVCIMKMAYGLDDQERHALLKNDPLVGQPDGRRWVNELSKRLKKGALRSSKALQEQNSFTIMSDDDIDRYLDQLEDILLKDRPVVNNDHFPVPIVDPAPAPDVPVNSWDAYHAAAADHLVKPSNAPTINIPARSMPLMPGEKLKSYDASDGAATLPESYETVLQAASEVIGVRMREISKLVEIFERKLEKIRLDRGIHHLSRSGSGLISRTTSGRGKRRSLGPT